jgi:hypothetical protein
VGVRTRSRYSNNSPSDSSSNSAADFMVATATLVCGVYQERTGSTLLLFEVKRRILHTRRRLRHGRNRSDKLFSRCTISAIFSSGSMIMASHFHECKLSTKALCGLP